MADKLDFPEETRKTLLPYLPTSKLAAGDELFVTLTYATSLDSQLSTRPGVQTVLSGPGSKAMTHFLRSQHDAILVGSGTAIADDPGLNCRLRDVSSQPRPIVLDRRGRWDIKAESRVLRTAKEGKGKAPWIFTSTMSSETQAVVEEAGGRIFLIEPSTAFADITIQLKAQGIRSVMVEGGGSVINQMLASESSRRLISSVIVTIAPTYLGSGGVLVSPEHDPDAPKAPVVRFVDVTWLPLEQDVVMLARVP